MSKLSFSKRTTEKKNDPTTPHAYHKYHHPDELFYCHGTRRKPKHRGLFHEITFLSLPLWSLPMLLQCRTTKALASVCMYIFSCIFCYGVSSQYHRRQLTYPQEVVLSKLDHVGIFIMVAYSYTPTIIFLTPSISIFLLVSMTACCVFGFLLIASNTPILWGESPPIIRESPQLMASIYILMGLCIGCLAVPEFISKCTTIEAISSFFMAVLYIAGGVIYALRWPDPWPHTFGYHEIFHVLVCCSGVLTYITNYSVISRLQ